MDQSQIDVVQLKYFFNQFVPLATQMENLASEKHWNEIANMVGS